MASSGEPPRSPRECRAKNISKPAREGRFDYFLVESTRISEPLPLAESLFGPAHGPHLATTSSSAVEQIAAIGLEPRDSHSGRHIESLQNLPRSRIDSPQTAMDFDPIEAGRFTSLRASSRSAKDHSVERTAVHEHTQPGPRIRRGQVSALFAFDIGYEVSLKQLTSLVPSSPVQPLSSKKRTPSFFQYTRPPHVLILGETTSPFDGVGQIQARVFDFGVLSIAYRWPLPADESGIVLTELPEVSQRLYGLNLAAEARNQAATLMAQIEGAITRPNLSSLVEDYYVFVIERLDSPLKASELLTQHRSTLAQTLRFETLPLSVDQQEDAIRQRLSYYEDDLLIIDWNAAIIYDQDFEDTASVLELLNVELLEARYIDLELDQRVRECAALAQRGRATWPIPLRTPFRTAVQDLTEWRIESSLLAERVGNSLKLVGDLYLARVYSAAAERFYLRQWETTISHKLDIIDDFYKLLTDRVRTAQSQALELAVVALILVELFVALFGRYH